MRGMMMFLRDESKQHEANATTYNILIQLFGEGGYFKEAVTVFNDMVEENIEINMGTYEGLIFSFVKGGMYEDARKILFYISENEIVPSIIKAYRQAALYKEVVMLNTVNEMGGMPIIKTFNLLIYMCTKGYKQSGKFEEDIKAYVEMEKVHFEHPETLGSNSDISVNLRSCFALLALALK
ncbi:hypothetical protein K2173_011505 [Erythroxylum novogranatense]|uniref:Pentatricopeptide repeat-containing protein n=1 Tax=Erythroxylum novogranatense TaxID=1862640 RepID=A0AAV8TT79_9ROSI|nr:hypothetical protein K2173_011505 [Erythroxylum novogranatense]